MQDVGGKSILKVNQMPQVKSHALKAVLALKGTEEDIS